MLKTFYDSSLYSSITWGWAASDSPFLFFFGSMAGAVLPFFFALDCFHPLYVAYLKKKMLRCRYACINCLLPLHLLLFPALAICWYILSGAKLVTFSVSLQGYTEFCRYLKNLPFSSQRKRVLFSKNLVDTLPEHL